MNLGNTPNSNLARKSMRLYIIKGILSLFIASVLLSCIDHQSYPVSWAPLIPSESGCMDIAGTYSNTDNDNARSVASLSNIIIKQWEGIRKPDKATHVEIITHNYESIDVVAWNENVFIAERTYTKKDYKCTDRGIEISRGIYMTDGHIAGIGLGKFTLTKAADGSLVVITEDAGFGLALMIYPLAAFESRYYRYPTLGE